MPNANANDAGVLHIVGNVQYYLDRLGLKIPRSLCGVVLVDDDPDRPDLPMNAPTCPRCARLNRGDLR